jgi:DNA ligase (NAD+)
MSRKEITNLIERHGGRVTGSVSRTTSYLVAGEAPGSKLDRARELEVDIIDEAAPIALAAGKTEEQS